MRIRFNEETGILDVDGVLISAKVLKELVNPDNRLLFRFERKDGIIQAIAFNENSVVWIEDSDLQDKKDVASIEFGMLKPRGNEEEDQK